MPGQRMSTQHSVNFLLDARLDMCGLCLFMVKNAWWAGLSGGSLPSLTYVWSMDAEMVMYFFQRENCVYVCVHHACVCT